MFRRMSRVAIVLVLMATVVPAVAGCAAEDEPQETAALRFVQFYDPECPFCQEMESIVEELRDEYEPKIESFEIVNVTTADGKALVEEFGVFLTPTFVILDGDDVELDRVTGAATKESMVTFIERGIDDVSGTASDEPREVIEGEGSALDVDGEPATE